LDYGWTLNTPVGSPGWSTPDWDEIPAAVLITTAIIPIIAGLDPTFLYKASHITYQTWVDITLGKFPLANLFQGRHPTLGSQYVLVANGHEVDGPRISSHPNFRPVYQDDEATIYAPVQEPVNQRMVNGKKNLLPSWPAYNAAKNIGSNRGGHSIGHRR